jgi:hypothetical protein
LNRFLPQVNEGSHIKVVIQKVLNNGLSYFYIQQEVFLNYFCLSWLEWVILFCKEGGLRLRIGAD